MICIKKNEQTLTQINLLNLELKGFAWGGFYSETETGSFFSFFSSLAESHQETSAPLGETTPGCMVKNRFTFLPFSGDRLYD